MDTEQWSNLVGRIKDTFTVEKEYTEDREAGEIATVIFHGPTGRMKLERDVHAKLLDTKAIGGSKVGAGNTIQKTYSENEKISTVKLYRANGDDWYVVDLDATSLLA